jgi:hypothetical protein
MELAIINGTYREPNLFPKKLQQIQFPNNRMPIGAPLILTPRMQQNLLAAQLQSGSAHAAMFATQAQQTLTAVPQGSLIQTTNANGEPNFVQFLTPLQTLDHMGGMLTGGAQLFEYQTQIDPSQAGKNEIHRVSISTFCFPSAFPFLTATTAMASNSAGIKLNSLYFLSSSPRPTSRACCYCHERTYHQHQHRQTGDRKTSLDQKSLTSL